MENIRSVLDGGMDDKIAEIDSIIRGKQNELLDAGSDEGKIDIIGDEIMRLREERQSLLTEAAMKQELQNHMEDMSAFLDSQTEAVTEYSEALVRRLVEKITVYDEKLTVEFKSGLSIDVDA